MVRFSKELAVLMVVAVLATCDARGQRSYFRRYAQRRQASEGSWGTQHQSGNNGNCEVTLTIPGGSSGCNCACPTSGPEPTHEMPPAEPPSPAPSECGSQNPFCDNPFAPSAESPAEAPAEDLTMFPAEPPSPAPSECGSQNPFCDNPFAPSAGIPTTGPPSASPPAAATTADPESSWSGTLSVDDEFCSHHYNCIACGTQDPSTCSPEDPTSQRGQCYYKWSSDEFFNNHCSSYPKCQTTCEVKK